METHLEIRTKLPESDPHATPLLFVHGAWHDAWCWAEHFLPYFAQHDYISYALDLRGHGKSQGRDRLRWTTIADYVSDIEQVASQLERAPVLIGHSMGGLVVQKYLEKHTAPAAVLLASVPPSGALRTTLSIAVRHPLAFLKANLTLSLYPIIGTPALTREAFFSPDMPEEKVQAYFARMQDESYRAFLDMMIFSLPHPKRVNTPMLVLGGGRDRIFTRKEVEATGRAYGTQAEIFPTMAHDLMLEEGWQAVADRILVWLEELGL
ncbi:MAG TPA: alpha/beta fold hydrolase [Ktedonobacteraceae bacterium]|nr:alpha/beta fold hydrolase [Ktedonobacteraceae bacterium]